MDIFEAIRGRRSCRDFLEEPIEREVIERILEAATWAPSPLNAQPWEFVVITDAEIKEKIFQEGNSCKHWGLEASGWKWLGKYQVEFLKTAPVLIVVIGDPAKTGLDAYMEGGRMGYQHGCAAAIQNMHLAAHALGLGSLWYTLYRKDRIREILDIPKEKDPLAIIVLGKPKKQPPAPPRKELDKKVRFIG